MSTARGGARRRVVLLATIVAVASACVADQPRWVSLAPSITELIFDLGLQTNLVARSSACDAPVEVATLPVAGDFGRPNLEAISALKATDVFVTDLERAAVATSLEALGVRTHVLPCESIAGVEKAVTTLAGLAQRDDLGESWLQAFRRSRDAIAARVNAHGLDKTPPTVFVELWRDPLTAPGHDSFVRELVELAGGRMISADLAGSYIHVSAEWVVQQNPDAIVLMDMQGDAADVASQLSDRLGWSGLKALKQNRVNASIPSDLLLRPGPRMLQGAEQLADWLAATDPATVASEAPEHSGGTR